MPIAVRTFSALPALFLLAACASGATQPRQPGSPEQPSVLELQLSPVPSASVLKREWEVEIEYDSQDSQAVFDFYDAELAAQGWTRVSFEQDGSDFDADYRKDDLELELEVELDSGKVEVEIEIDETLPQGGAYSLTSLPGLELAFVPSLSVLELEWDIDTDYDSQDVAGIFSHYAALVEGQGWRRVSYEEEDGEIEATYRKEGLELELEVELDDGKVEVEIDVEQRLADGTDEPTDPGDVRPAFPGAT
jgi:hypothetical protein